MAEKICDKTVDMATREVRFAFADGRILHCALDDLPENIQRNVALHGISAKVGDCYAGAAKEKDPVDWAYRAACETWQAMCGGEWTSRREGGNLLAEALARATGRTDAEAVEAIAKLDDAAKKKLAKVPAIKVALAQIALERAQAKVGESDLTNDPLDLLA